MMKLNGVRKFMAIALTVATVLSTGVVNVYADDQTVPVTGDIAPTVMSVMSPGAFTFSQDATGNVVTASNLQAVNNTLKGQVEVTNFVLTKATGWEIEAFTADYSNMPVNTNVFGMQVNNENVDKTTGTVALADENWHAMAANGGTLDFDYEINLAGRTEVVPEGTQVGSVVITYSFI
jgi:hypothetical protein